jgi:hypothetical protein
MISIIPGYLADVAVPLLQFSSATTGRPSLHSAVTAGVTAATTLSYVRTHCVTTT